MEYTLSKVRKQFTIITIAVAVCCAAIASFGTYVFAEHQLQQKITASKIGQLAANDSELSAYIASQKPYHAHFETIAKIIQKEDQKQLATSLPIVLALVFTISGILGWWLSRRLLAPVEQAYLSQKRFMQDATHELRNPLAATSTMIQQAQNNPPNAKEFDTFIRSIDRQNKRLSAITTDLILLEHSEIKGQKEVDISDLLRDVLEQLQPQASEKGVAITTNLDKALYAKIEPQHFVYIAKNILENAIKFSSKSSKPIQVQLTAKRGGFALTVRDYGIGIPKDELALVSQRFYRAKNASTIDGTGLGLAITSKYVTLYKGTIVIKSTKPGTVVSVNL